MIKNFIIFILLVICGFSLFAIYHYWNTLLPDYIGEENRLKKVSGIYYYYGNLEDRKDNSNLLPDHPFLDSVQIVLDNLTELQNGVIELSGGLNPQTAEFINAYGRSYVKRFFFDENHRLSYANNKFENTLKTYLETVEKYDIESSFPEQYKIHQKHYPEILNNLTVTEAHTLLDYIKMSVIQDKYNFLLNEQKNAR